MIPAKNGPNAVISKLVRVSKTGNVQLSPTCKEIKSTPCKNCLKKNHMKK